ncbi:MAG: hypothetical protein JW982_15510 [Spirochaetes bacterium]|nr:hypothetical protein [Spirochaetota bacterium]
MIDVKTIDDRLLKDFLLMGETVFQKGRYEEYIEEAKRRNLDLSFLEMMKPENKKINNLNSLFSMKDFFNKND